MDPGVGGELAVFTANIFTACSSGGKQGASAANAGAAEAQQEGGHGYISELQPLSPVGRQDIFDFYSIGDKIGGFQHELCAQPSFHFLF